MIVGKHDGAINVDFKACHQTGTDTSKALETIKRLNLDCVRLRNARQAVWEQLNDELAKEWDNLGDDATDDDFEVLRAISTFYRGISEFNNDLLKAKKFQHLLKAINV